MTRTIYSEAHPAPARADRPRPLVVERTIAGLEPELLDVLQAFAESAQQLPPPFQQVVAIERRRDGLEVTLDRFCGVTGLQLQRGLGKAKRLLPLPVWLAVADAWLRALEAIAITNATAWRTAWSAVHVGVDVTGALTFAFDEHNHVLGHWPTPVRPEGGIMGPSLPFTLSPELLRDRPITDAARVFTMGAALIQVLTHERPFDDDTELGRLKSVLEGTSRWGHARHPDCPAGLAAVLDRAIRPDPGQRFPSIAEFRGALLDAADTRPADADTVAGVFFGSRPDRLDEIFAELAADPAQLPAEWQRGGLQVMQDRLLELRVPLEALPDDPGKTAEVRPGRPPRVNLAPAARPSFWQRLWGATSRRGS